MLRTAFVIALLALPACTSAPASPTPVDRQLTLAPGQSAQATDGLAVRFVGVPADSRCPGDAICITGGDATVRLEVSGDGSRVERDLHTASRQPVSHDGATIELVSLDPYPFHTRPIQPADYRATLRVRR